MFKEGVKDLRKELFKEAKVNARIRKILLKNFRLKIYTSTQVKEFGKKYDFSQNPLLKKRRKIVWNFNKDFKKVRKF